ncbi:C-type lectin domain family 4 member A-like [Saccostrea echinata]|uniref:C-type lectin domain family 4 member A-like n=1 Tax=Saccostrea echinata TaxID=191078 RepID=UPI002A82852D|nr:C-type lectin domain family 4 member A-like [Saccostrea echinata]
MSCGRLCKKNGGSTAFSHIENKCYCYRNRTDGQSFTVLEGAQYYFLSDDYFFLSDERNCKDHNYQYLSEIRVCYKDYNDSKIWQDANKKCGSDGGHLIMLDTVEKLSVFQNIIPENVYYWVGLEDMDEDGTWIWTNNKSKEFDRNLWFPKDPNGNDEFCGMVQYYPSDSRVGIFDVRCDKSNRFICEM